MRLWAGLAAALAAGLGAAEGVVVTATPAPAELWAAFPARIDNRAQLGHAPPLNWMNVAWVADDGDRVVPGDPLIHLDTKWNLKWLEEDERIGRQKAAEWERSRLDSADRLADLERRRLELAEQLPALAAALAESAYRDEARLAQARLRRERTADDAQRLAERATAAEALATAGRLPAADAASARSAATAAAIAAQAAQHHLELEEDPEPGISEVQAQLRLERLQAAIGNELHGLGREAAASRQREEATLLLEAENHINHQAGLARLRSAIADPVVRATRAGSVRRRHAQITPGAKLPATAAVFVCGTGEQVADFGLPEELRGLVRPWSEQDPEAGRAEVEVLGPAGPYRIPGRVLSIGAAPESRPDGHRAFPALVGLGPAGDTVRLGMPATVHLAVNAPPGSLTAPAFCLGWAGRPMMLGPDGALPVEAVPVGASALILSGLAAGQALRPWDPAALGQAPRRRLSGVLEAWERLPVRLRTTQWDVVEIAPDGSLVEAGAVVARLVRNVWWIDVWNTRRSLVTGRARAAARRDQARAEAVISLTKAEVERRQTTIDTMLARIDLLVTVAPPLAEDVAAAEGAALEAAAQARRAAAAVPRPEEDRPDLSAGARTALAATAAKAVLAAERAALAAVKVRRNAGLVAVLGARERERSARERGERAAGTWLLARTVYLRQLAGAARTFRHTLRETRRNREQLEGELLRAPATGRIHHRPGRPYRAGDSIDTLEPLYVPDGPARRLAFSIPASSVPRFPTGATVPVIIPGLGAEGRSATVIACGTRYGTPDAASDAATGAQVADLLLRLDLDPADADRAGPGMTAYVDL